MDVTSRALRTDLAVAALDGDVIDHGDHVAVAMPAEPDFYWGNYLVIAPPLTAADTRRWLERADAVVCAGARHTALALDGAALTADARAALGTRLRRRRSGADEAPRARAKLTPAAAAPQESEAGRRGFARLAPAEAWHTSC